MIIGSSFTVMMSPLPTPANAAAHHPTTAEVLTAFQQWCSVDLFKRDLYYDHLLTNTLMLALKTDSGKSSMMQINGHLLGGVALIIILLLVLGADQACQEVCWHYSSQGEHPVLQPR